MRKFKCIELNQTNGFTEGNIYEIGDDGIIHYDSGNPCLAGIFRINGDKAECWWSKFEEVFDDKEEGEKVGKFKVGDMVRIIKNGTHCFEKGDIVELYEINERKDMLRGKQKGNSRDFGNWIEFNEMELIKESTFTITTSDTITTLTDGTHTTSINRHYTDKHDDMVALEEVVKKYKSEIEEMGRKIKEKHLLDDETNCDYGVIGTLTILTDSVGRKLFVGDVVKVYNKDGSDDGFIDLVCNDNEDGDFIMGCACATRNNSKKEYNYLKEMSYEDISNYNKIWDSCLVIK